MALQKADGLLIGRGDLKSNARSAFAFSSAFRLGAWANNLPYPLESVVEFGGRYYRTLAALGSGPNPDPATDTANWEILQSGAAPKDGDVAAIVPGTSPTPQSDIMLRNNGVWVSLVNNPILVVLADNTLGQNFLTVPLSIAKGSTLELSIDRFPNRRRSNLRYESDGTIGPSGASLTEYGVTDIGAGDVGVTFTAQVNGAGTAVEILADTDSQLGAPILVKYTIKGWT